MEADNTQVVEAVVAQVSDLKNGEMREVAIGEAGKVLLIKENNEFKAIGNKCTHYGAPLKDGVLCNGKVRCPWHGACFSTTTGDIEDSPGLDSVHRFNVRVEGEDVIVAAEVGKLKVWKRSPACSKLSPQDKRVFVIIGAGAAGSACAETLRGEGFTGRVVVIGREPHLPYDRIKLSKAMTAKVDSILLRNEAFFQENNIELLLGQEVTELDVENKTVKLRSGESIAFDSVCVASGGDPRRLPIPGAELGNIFGLRVAEDAHQIAAAAEGKNLVIVGSSFIGMEVAATLAAKAKSVSVVGMEKVPFERVLGEEVGTAIRNLHEAKGIKFYMQRVTKEFKGQDGLISQVVLDDGAVLDADICVVGAGIVPATSFIKPGSIKFERDGSVVTDEYLKVAENAYAAGDLARFPYFLTGELVRVEHWGFSQIQGRLAARNMLGKQEPLRHVPFFWTVQFGKSVRYAGHALSFNEVIVQGSLADQKFVSYYVRDDRVLAAAALGMDPIASAVAELLAIGKMPSATELKTGQVDLKALLN